MREKNQIKSSILFPFTKYLSLFNGTKNLSKKRREEELQEPRNLLRIKHIDRIFIRSQTSLLSMKYLEISNQTKKKKEKKGNEQRFPKGTFPM